MGTMQYLPVDPDAVPYRFQARLAGTTYGFEVQYNTEGDFFTLDLFDRDWGPICLGEKIIYGSPLWGSVADSRFPRVAIVPWDLSQQADAVTQETLGTSVFLYLLDREALDAALGGSGDG